MHRARWTVVLAGMVAVGAVASHAHWVGLLIQGHKTWVLGLPRAPVWAPPPAPTFASFRKTYMSYEDFPVERGPNSVIDRSLNLDPMARHLFLYLWPVTVLAGILHLTLRDERRDFVLYVGSWAGIGYTVGLATSVVGWLTFGGWGPDLLGNGGLGFVAGVVVGLASFKRVPV